MEQVVRPSPVLEYYLSFTSLDIANTVKTTPKVFAVRFYLYFAAGIRKLSGTESDTIKLATCVENRTEYNKILHFSQLAFSFQLTECNVTD